jgi:hypothetical protein
MRSIWGLVRVLACAAGTVVGTAVALAQSTGADAPPPPIDISSETPRTGPCPVAAIEDWTDAEKWAWQRICEGSAADMALHDAAPLNPGDQVSINPGDYKAWRREDRYLGAGFLQRILSDAAYVEAITFQGVRIEHAVFDEPINLSFLRFDKPLEMFEVVFTQPLVMRDYHTASIVVLAGSWLAFVPPKEMIPPDFRQLPRLVSLDMVGAQVGRDLVIDGTTTGDVDLTDTAIGQHVYLDNVTANGVIELSGTRIGGMLYVRSADICCAFGLRSASIGRDAIFARTRIAYVAQDGTERLGSLQIDNTHIAGSLYLGSGLDVVKMPEDTQPKVDITLNRDAIPPETVPAPETPPESQQQPQSAQPQAPRNPVPAPYTFQTGDLSLNSAVIGRRLSIRTADIRYYLEMQSATIAGDMWLTTSKVGSDPRYRNYLSEMKVGGYLLLQDSEFAPQLFMDGAEIGRHVVMSDKTKIKGELKMRGASILTNFHGEGAQVTGPVDMQSISIGRDLYLTRGTRFDGDLNATFAHIGGSLDLTGGHFASVDLTGSHIAAELRLANDIERSNIAKNSTITLRNVEADSLLDVTGVWPDRLELDGFTYRRFGGAVPPDSADASAGTAKRRVGVRSHSADELLAWLDRQRTFSTQPYSHLATMLRQSGDRETADAITFQAKKLQWQHAPLFSGTKLLLGIEYIFTGFGVHPLRLLYWVAGLVALGFLLFSRDESPAILKMGFWQRWLYSFDMLLPVVHLRHHHAEIQLEWVWARVYLYIHKIMGYVLIALLLAAITAGHQIE